ncbi:MAG: SPOR domain-containing protein [Rhodospirillaceae bacterium]|nr:SPOR domain-containing protein [Rhodospirillaceae bacterium]
MGQLLDCNKIRRNIVLPLGIAGAVLLASCAKMPDMMPKDTGEAAEQVKVAKQADKKAHMAEQKELAKERREEKTEDKEILALNERIHTLSLRVEDLSERMHQMTQRLEHDPLKIAEMELAIKAIEERIGDDGAEHKAPRHGMTKKSPKMPAKSSGKAFWGIQIAAYKTEAGAKEAWAELLDNPMAIELQEAKVQYIKTKPMKNGKRLILAVINDYPSHKAANDACESLKERGIDCVAARIRP